VGCIGGRARLIGAGRARINCIPDIKLRQPSKKLTEKLIMSAHLIQHFAPLEDPRIERNKLYPLPEVILLVICAVLGRADDWQAIEQFGHDKLEWLRKFAPYPSS